jgi:hypothetical protein
MDRADWLRDRMRSFGCAACGWGYEPERVRLLAERDGLWFVALACAMCGDETEAIVTLQPTEDGGDALSAPELPASRPADAIGADDVLRIHELLDGYSGDVGGLLTLLGAGGGPAAR